LLPPITRVRGCLFNCDPAAPHCPEHRPGLTLGDGPGGWAVETVPGPFRELSHSTKLATAVGSLDLGRLVGVVDPAAALLPGLIPQAHRGVLFVDEINRLADTAPELTDVLLDVMGTKPGRLQVEEAGLPAAELSLTATVWAASNPDEDPGPLADLRRQLADRFDLVVTVERPAEAAVVAEIAGAAVGRLAGVGVVAGAPGAAGEESAEGRQYAASVREGLVRAAALVDQVRLADPVREAIAELYCRCGVESLRAAEGLAVASVYHCALRGGLTVERRDLAAVLPLVLAHRLEPERLRQAEEIVRGKEAVREAPGRFRGLGAGR
jgi:magnesium chelatase subunit I